MLLATVMFSSAMFADWQRVTTVAELLQGGTMIIGYEETANSGIIVPMRTEGTANASAAGYLYSGSASGQSGKTTIDMAKITETSDYEVTVVPSATVENAICIKIGDNFIGNTNTKNNCKLFSTESNTTAFTPSVGDKDVFTLKITANQTYHTLSYNSSSPRFACYGGTQKNVVIYKKVAGEEIPATGIALSETNVSLAQYKRATLTATLTPAEATTAVVWSSSDETIAVVSKGEVTAVGIGSAIITATAGEGVTATCEVTVTSAPILTCAEAAEIALAVSEDNEVAEGGMHVIRGYITEVFSNAESNLATYGNYSFWMADAKDATNLFEGYQVAPTDGQYLTAVGDYVEVICDLTKYNTTPETVAKTGTVRKLQDPATSIDNATEAVKAVKVIENGQMVIIRGGVKYNAQGAVIE